MVVFSKFSWNTLDDNCRLLRLLTFQMAKYISYRSLLTISLPGSVYSWGDGDYGKLGRGGSDGSKVPKVIEKLEGQGVTRVFCGAQFSMALTKTGVVYSWYV